MPAIKNEYDKFPLGVLLQMFRVFHLQYLWNTAFSTNCCLNYLASSPSHTLWSNSKLFLSTSNQFLLFKLLCMSGQLKYTLLLLLCLFFLSLPGRILAEVNITFSVTLIICDVISSQFWKVALVCFEWQP